MNGRIDLSQAEAVIDIIRAKTDKALPWQIDSLPAVYPKNKGDPFRFAKYTCSYCCKHRFSEEDIPEADSEFILKEITVAGERVKELLKGQARDAYSEKGCQH